MTRGLKRHYVKAPAAQHELTHTQKKKRNVIQYSYFGRLQYETKVQPGADDTVAGGV